MPYWKPIQTGSEEETDSETVRALSNSKIYPSSYVFKAPVSPHLAAKLENQKIDLKSVICPKEDSLVIEGAGGIFTPLNDSEFIIDLIEQLNIPVLLVARSTLGTINHTLLTLQALRQRNISILGVITNGPHNKENQDAIEFYGQTKVLHHISWFEEVSQQSLASSPLKPMTLPFSF